MRLRSLVLCWMLLLPSAAGFASVPGQDVHTSITEDAAQRAGWPSGGVDALVEAVVELDHDEMAWAPEGDEPAGIRLKDTYDPAHHCDRLVPAPDDASLAATIDYIRQERDRALSGDAAAAAQAAGHALHALQDCFSHSDFVDLGPAQQERFVAALLGNGTPPQVRLIGVSRQHDPPGMPPDPYPHDRYAKDHAGMNEEADRVLPDGRTKFEAARDAATDASTLFLEWLLSELAPGVLAEIDDLEGGRWQAIPAPAVLWLLVLLPLARARRTDCAPPRVA